MLIQQEFQVNPSLQDLKGKYVAVVVTVIGTIGAIVYPMDDITDFLYLIGSVFASMIAVQIADFFILKKEKIGNRIRLV